MTVAEVESDKASAAAPGDAPSAPAVKSVMGLSVVDLTDAQKTELRLKGGVRVEAVDGAAARAGVREGDVITLLDNIEVNDVKQFTALAAKLDKTKPITVLVRRGEWVNYVVIRPSR